MTPSAKSSYSTTSMRARAATARNDRSWHDDAEITNSSSGSSSSGFPRNTGSALNVNASVGGVVDTECVRS
jgi:hypothetical protein